MIKTITPAAIKAAAKCIRGIESERLGKSLPNTTVLNALTQGFGLGQGFAAFANANSQDPSSPAAPASVTSTASAEKGWWKATGFIALRAPSHEIPDTLDAPIFDAQQQKKIHRMLPGGWVTEIPCVMNGIQQIRIIRHSACVTRAFATDEARTVLTQLRDGIERAFPDLLARFPIIDSFSGVETSYPQSPRLRVLYSIENGYSAEAGVSLDLWDAAIDSNLSEAEALILLDLEQEIEAQVTASDIRIDEVLTEPAPHTKRKTQAVEQKAVTTEEVKSITTGEADAPQSTVIYILYRINQDQYDGKSSAFIKDEYESIMDDAPEYWDMEIYDAMHGYQMISIAIQVDEAKGPIYAEIQANSEAEAVLHLVSHHAPGFLEDARLVNDGIIVPPKKDNQTLHVNFRYLSTGQLCTADVSQSHWDVFTQHLSQEEAMLLLAGDIEISPHYTDDDIIVDDVMTEFEIYTG